MQKENKLIVLREETAKIPLADNATNATPLRLHSLSSNRIEPLHAAAYLGRDPGIHLGNGLSKHLASKVLAPSSSSIESARAIGILKKLMSPSGEEETENSGAVSTINCHGFSVGYVQIGKVQDSTSLVFL